MRRNNVFVFAVGAAVCLGLWLAFGGGEVDRRIPVKSAGRLSIDMELGRQLAFDKGSLTISTHPLDEVRVIVDTTGWGEYAVDIDIEEVQDGVRVEGRVDGVLYWLFGGPTVDLSVFVPENYSVDARIVDGPLTIEDLQGPIDAEVEGDELIVRRAEGGLKLVATGGPVSIEDIEGPLEIEALESDVEISGLRGDLLMRAGRGRTEISSVKGRVDVISGTGRIEVDRLDGDARLVSESGSVRVEGMEGDLEVRTERGRIRVEELEGKVLAKSGKGGIDVRFVGDPAGVIETQHGSIDVEVPRDAAFDLQASAKRGRVELDSDFDFEHETGVGFDPVDAYSDLGKKIAARVHENVQRGLATGNWDFEWDFDFEATPDVAAAPPESGERRGRRPLRREERWKDFWNHHEDGDADAPWGLSGAFSGRSVQIVGSVNGGGAPLHLHTEKGSIQIDDR